MRLLLYILINVLIVGLFLYSKLTPYKNRLTGKYFKTFNFFEGIFNPLLNFLKKIAKPAQVGNGIAVDMSQIILLFLLLLTLKFVL
ncbi:MAG: YggT family protein [Bacteroidetes bacterium]|nr:YggT family protein [Bacteroidota bacterium]